MDAAVAAHVGSFNFAIKEGLQHAIRNIPFVEATSDTQHVRISFENASVKKFTLPDRRTYTVYPLCPKECRLRAETYCANLIVKLKFQTSAGMELFIERKFNIPVAVKSFACQLQDSKEDWENEEENNLGGYFLINGKERLLRMFLIQRRNYPLAIVSPLWKKTIRNERFTQFGIRIRCVAIDETISEVTLRYLEDYDAKLMFSYNGYNHFVSFMLLLKSLGDYSDHELFRKVCAYGCDTFTKRCVTTMLRKLQDEDILTHCDAKTSFGSLFKSAVQLPNSMNITDFILRECILIHLDKNEDKVNMLCYMLKKLFDLVQGKCSKEDPDNFINQELLLGGQLYLILLKFELKNFLRSVKCIVEKKLKSGGRTFTFNETLAKYCTNHAAYIGGHLKLAISTGNIPATKLGLKLPAGYSILCERTNMAQFCSHFTAVHKFIFNSYSTMSFRRLQPEYWGYFCPIHTPSGETTGLSNHLAHNTLITHSPINRDHLCEILNHFGVLPCSLQLPQTEVYTVMLDGHIFGFVPDMKAEIFVLALKSYCRPGKHKDLQFVEIVLVYKDELKIKNEFRLHPGIYIFTTPGRILRPLKNICNERKEYIGPFEQLFLFISPSPKERCLSLHSYEEVSNQNLLSNIGSTIPFLEYNFSPRNILSCQMMKQAIGISSHKLHHRSDTKAYQFTHPQIPLVKTPAFNKLHLDEYPAGTNAVVAVISYSGYDLEDAIVFNKSSLEYGLSHMSIIKTTIVDLQEKAKEHGLNNRLRFLRDDRFINLNEKLDVDGLPYLGQKLSCGDPYISYVENDTERSFVEYYRGEESAYVQEVNLLGNHESPLSLTKVAIKFRIARNVEIGDKFANRHGQKGVVGRICPAEDMPFTEQGIIPDILFNPHGFPSRMSIGMAIEAMAGLSSASSAEYSNIVPFEYSEKNTAVDHFANELLKAGFNLYCTDKMYSGVSGQELNVSIFHGIVYYQRLRHMVADKYQVRSVGKVSSSLQQPIKSDPRDGAIRIGEMERDSLLAHGSSFLLRERFHTSNDLRRVYLCRNCKGILYPPLQKEKDGENLANCDLCDDAQDLVPIRVPYAFAALVAELSCINIKIKLS